MLELLLGRRFPSCIKVKHKEKVNRSNFVSNQVVASKFVFINKQTVICANNEFYNKMRSGDGLNPIILKYLCDNYLSQSLQSLHSYVLYAYSLAGDPGNISTKTSTRGSPQGSVLNPFLQKISFETILSAANSGDCNGMGFNDNLAIFVTRLSPVALTSQILVQLIFQEGRNCGLTFSGQNTLHSWLRSHPFHWGNLRSNTQIELNSGSHS